MYEIGRLAPGTVNGDGLTRRKIILHVDDARGPDDWLPQTNNNRRPEDRNIDDSQHVLFVDAYLNN